MSDADVIIVGGGLAGLVAAAELIEARRKVILVDQEPEQSLGGQAFWSFGGIFLVDSPEQRLMGIHDSYELALEDWMGTAAFDRPEDHWPRRWAEAYVAFAAGEKGPWLRERGIKFFPVVGWAERGGGNAIGHGNSVPRFHVTWGTGPGVVEPFVDRVREGAKQGLVTFKFRHRVNELTRTNGAIDGVRGDILIPSDVERGFKSSRHVAGQFELKAQAVIVASGGIGANHELVRKNWPQRLGSAPKRMITGVPDHVDGRMLAITEAAGGSIINRDRMWHYVEGIKNWSPIWTDHAIRILPGPSSLWLDARGNRLPVPLYPGFDTLATLRHLRGTGHDYSWFILNQKIIAKEFALSGSEQNPDFTNKVGMDLVEGAFSALRKVGNVTKAALGGAESATASLPVKTALQAMSALRSGVPGPVQAFMDKGEDFIVERELPALVARMNKLTGDNLLTLEGVEREIRARDRQLDDPFCKDMQIMAIRSARNYLGDELIRTAPPHKLLDPDAGPLIAVRLNILTRKTLGGLQTDLDSRVLGEDGSPVPGLYAAGEVAGFGGGGVHGYSALEGTFLGGCIFSGRAAGRHAGQGAR